MRLKELAAARIRYGYRRLHILLRTRGLEGEPTSAPTGSTVTKGCQSGPGYQRASRACVYRQGQPAIGDPTRSGR